jgi:hypothetical protein
LVCTTSNQRNERRIARRVTSTTGYLSKCDLLLQIEKVPFCVKDELTYFTSKAMTSTWVV